MDGAGLGPSLHRGNRRRHSLPTDDSRLALEPKAKNRNRIHYLMANVELSRYQGKNAWAVLLDPDGFLTEGTGSNFFLVKDG